MDTSEVDQGVCFWSSSLPKDSKEVRCPEAVDLSGLGFYDNL